MKVYKIEGSDKIDIYDVISRYPIAEYCVYWYVNGDYDGSGNMITKLDSKFYQDDLGHCSCYGPTDRLGDENPCESINQLIRNSSEGLQEELRPLIEKIKELENIF